jgi:hypothetical protein
MGQKHGGVGQKHGGVRQCSNAFVIGFRLTFRPIYLSIMDITLSTAAIGHSKIKKQTAKFNRVQDAIR